MTGIPRSDDGEAWNRVLVIAYLRAYKILRGDRAAAEDIAQDVAVAICSLPRDAPIVKVEAWATTVARRLALNVGRKRQNERRALERIGHPPDRVDHPADLPSWMVLELLYRDVLKLPLAQREALYAVDFLGLSYEEAVTRSDISVNTLKTNLRRARASVRARMLDQGEIDDGT
ncbi:MAG: sigma-70 family RNA polymerase sigma factor [Acidimicrobiales bacterium]